MVETKYEITQIKALQKEILKCFIYFSLLYATIISVV